MLLGQPELRERIARIPQLAQRVLIHHHIEYLDRAETKAYILARLAAAGSTFPIFSPRAIAAVYHRTDGVCRLINSLCDLCLYSAHVAGTRRITRAFVEKLAQDVWHGPDPTRAWVMP